MIKRRQFIRNSALATAGLCGAGSLVSSWSALANEPGGAQDYRALVCVFLFGGMDNHDFILPYAPSAYSDFYQVRASLLEAQAESRSREALLPLGNSLSPEWALPPEMPGLHGLYQSGAAALVGNVGPLIEPVNRQTFVDQSVRLPPHLFSHNDQQATWQSSEPEGAQYGWGGLFLDALLGPKASADALAFSAISASNAGPFLTGRLARPHRVSPSGSAQYFLLQALDNARNGAADELYTRLRSHLTGVGASRRHVFERDVASAHANALVVNERFNEAVSGSEPLTTAFPGGGLGGQLRTVAQSIAAREQLGARRQVFFVGVGGFDTHSAQATTLPGLLQSIDQGVTAFHASMRELGLGEQVTLFSASDFGRTLAVNGDGTDHGWGAHHFLVGDAVQGGQLFGDLAPPALGHDADAGSGRLIPGLSVEQFAAPLGRWLGLDEEGLANALPRLANFDSAPGLFGA